MKKIIMYSTQTWPHCRTAKEFLSKNGLLHEIRDVNTNQAARDEFNKLGAQGVPAFLIDNQVIVGFDGQRIMDVLDYKVEKCPSCGARMRVPKNKGKIRVTCHGCQHRFVVTT